VLSVDEKSQIQALDRTQPGLPLKKGRAGAGRKTFVTQLREYASSRESSWRGLDPGFNAKLKRGAPELSEFDRRNVAAVCLGSMVSVPLRRGPMNWCGRFTAIFLQPRRWTAGEVALVEEVSERTWAAIERARAEAAGPTSRCSAPRSLSGYAKTSRPVTCAGIRRTGRKHHDYTYHADADRHDAVGLGICCITSGRFGAEFWPRHMCARLCLA
jgi:hypothetical protein